MIADARKELKKYGENEVGICDKVGLGLADNNERLSQ